LGLLGCLLAGCAVQPTGREAHAVDPAGANGAQTPASAVATAAQSTLQTLARGSTIRLGIEFLPPDTTETGARTPSERARAEAVRTLDPVRAPLPRPVERIDYGGVDRANRHTWTMTADDLSAMRDPVARETLRFLDLVMGEDRRRVKREFGTPLMSMQAIDPQSPAIDLPAEEAQADEEEEWQALHGLRMLKRPFVRMLKQLPLTQAVEVELDHFKSDNVPMSEAFVAAHREARGLGRVSMRIDANDFDDPLELTYRRSGLRVGSNRTRLKLGYRHDLLDNLSIDLRIGHVYSESGWRLRADLSWEVSERSSLHVVAGDDLDFMTTSTVYSLFESPMDGSPGLVVYASHLF
jgi:hypothetical protein